MQKKDEHAIKEPQTMTEQELADELKGSLLILRTSSPDKRSIYRLMFSSHAKDADHYAGLNLFFTDSGALGIVPRKTDERTGHYLGNLEEKAHLQLAELQDPEIQEAIRLKLIAGQIHTLEDKEVVKKPNVFNAEKINIVGMTEDSGWQLVFDDKEKGKQFITNITEAFKKRLRSQDEWLLKEIDVNGFPGPNLKPIQEHLPGGFHEMMEMIYEEAEKLDIKKLRFSNTTNISFVSPKGDGKYFSKSFESSGRLLTHAEYEDQLLSLKMGEAINSHFIQVPDGQKNKEQKSENQLIEEGLYTRSSKDLSASFSRRELTEYLQELVGKRRSEYVSRKRLINIAFVEPGDLDARKPGKAANHTTINDYVGAHVSTYPEMREDPNLKPFGEAEVVVLMPEKPKPYDGHLRSDPNLRLLQSYVVTAETDPESMSIPIVVDNRTGHFNNALKQISDAFIQGRLLGDPPFYVANTTEELNATLDIIKDFKQRAPAIKRVAAGKGTHVEKVEMKMIPKDGVFTAFVGGGHSNNAKQDRDEAKAFGMFCAENKWRIVTGAGSVEGSMGGVHTGFIQYHLDRIQKGIKSGKIKLDEADLKELKQYLSPKTEKYDAEKLIVSDPELIEKFTDRGLIPRDMFYGYSMQSLLELESVGGKAPPGITYSETGNRVRRLDGLLAPGNKILMRGSIGTDEEFEETVRQHVEARTKGFEHKVFADGTPNDKGALIIYNRNGNLDRLLRNYGLLGDNNEPITAIKRKRYGITIVKSLEELKAVSEERSQSWAEMVKPRPIKKIQPNSVRSM